MLYLHEIIDIVGTGQEAYLKTVAERAVHSEGGHISRLVGTWKVIGSTNRWPRVVNLWEMEGWSHWAESLERQFVPDKKDPGLAPWWARATEWRSGGFDRILEPAVFCPTLADLRARSLRAWVCVHSVVKLHAGRRGDYLSAVDHTLRPLLEQRGLTLMGAYTVPMLSNEVVLIWAAPDFRVLCDVYDSRRSDSEWKAWARTIAPLYEAFETMWIVPSADCFFHPLHQQ